MLLRDRHLTTVGMILLFARSPGCAAGGGLEARSGQGPGSHGRQRRRKEHPGFTHHPPLRAAPRTHHVGRPRHRHPQPLVVKEAGDDDGTERPPYVRNSADDCAQFPQCLRGVAIYLHEQPCFAGFRPKHAVCCLTPPAWNLSVATKAMIASVLPTA